MGARLGCNAITTRTRRGRGLRRRRRRRTRGKGVAGGRTAGGRPVVKLERGGGRLRLKCGCDAHAGDDGRTTARCLLRAAAMAARARRMASMNASARPICSWAKANVQQHCATHTTHHHTPIEAVKRLEWLRGMTCVMLHRIPVLYISCIPATQSKRLARRRWRPISRTPNQRASAARETCVRRERGSQAEASGAC